MNSPGAAWLKLRLQSSLANSDEDIDRNVEFTLNRNYTRFQDLFDTQSGAVAIVGSGPSLKKNWKKLRDFKGDIVACNAACQFLLERDIVPKYMFCFDADPLIFEFFTKHPDVTYLIASRVPPKTWELLEGCKVVVWHAGGDTNIEKLLQKHGRVDAKAECMVTGGSAAVTRCMHLVQPLGYKEIHLWGADSSFTETDTHIRQSTTLERRIQVKLNGREFETAPWMAQQVEDFKILVPAFTTFYGIRIVVHGDGLLPYVARTMTRPGCAEYEGIPRGLLRTEGGEPLWKLWLREWQSKASNFWKLI
jgi:uncharacterized Rossmann fold enzyme